MMMQHSRLFACLLVAASAPLTRHRRLRAAGRLEEANRALTEVLACGGTTLAEAEADVDLAALRAAARGA
jgi:hypothetical protein